MKYVIAIVSDQGALEIIETDFDTEGAAWARVEQLPTNDLDQREGVDERFHVFEQETQAAECGFEFKIDDRDFYLVVATWHEHVDFEDAWGWTLYDDNEGIVAQAPYPQAGNLAAIGAGLYAASVIALGKPLTPQEYEAEGYGSLHTERTQSE
jgi:hypothetical protein